MKRLLLYILPLVLISCEDFLNREPITQVSTQQLMSDISGIEMALSGAYSMIASSGLLRTDPWVISELKAGDLKFGRKSASASLNRFRDSYEFTHTFDNGSGNDLSYNLYEKYYTVLYTLNQIISALPNLTEGEDSYRNQLMGEALALRGIMHFELSKWYAQPYITSGSGNHLGIVIAEKVFDPMEQPGKSPLYKVYNSITQDLRSAAKLMTLTREGKYARAYLSKSAAFAILSRVYLYMNDWNNAISFADSILTKPHEFLSNTQYNTAWHTYAPISEGLWYINSDNIYSYGISGYCGISNETGFYPEFNVSRSLYDLYEENDIRLKLFEVNSVSGDTACVKHMSVEKRERPLAYIRTSEVYLIRAEASARIGKYIQARSDLYKIRSRAIPGSENINTSGEQLIGEIIIEKHREMALEGQAYFDNLRLGIDLIRTDFNGTQNRNVLFPDNRFVLPIPDYATNFNDNLEQNTDY